MLPNDTFHDVAARIATWLRHAFPKHTVKEAARTFSASPVTVKKWLEAQYPPENRHILAMIKHWGFPFLRYVYAPLLPGTQDLAVELAVLKQRVVQLEPQLNQYLALDPKTYFQARNQAELLRLAEATAQDDRANAAESAIAPRQLA